MDGWWLQDGQDVRTIKIETQKHRMKDIWEKQHMATSSFRGAHFGYLSLILQRRDVRGLDMKQVLLLSCCPLTQKRSGMQLAPDKPSQACLLAM